MLVGMAIALMGACAWAGARTAAHPRPARSAKPVNAARTEEVDKHRTSPVHFDLLAKLLADDRRSDPANDWLRALADPGPPFRIETQRHALVGQLAPDFTLRDQRDRPWNLHDQLDRGPVIVVFYLGYYCNACVQHLFELNADLQRFHRLGAEVVVVSGDSADLTRQQFERYGAFGFPVLSDPDHRVAEAYQTFRRAEGTEEEKLLHGTFIIARNCHVCWVNSGDAPFRVNMALLHEVARLENVIPQSASAIRPETAARAGVSEAP
jgi:peroxiredoxin